MVFILQYHDLLFTNIYVENYACCRAYMLSARPNKPAAVCSTRILLILLHDRHAKWLLPRVCTLNLHTSDHAGARQCAGIVNEKFAFQSLSYMDFEISDFSLTSGDVCAQAQTSGVKNIVSTIFFTLYTSIMVLFILRTRT